MKEEEFCVETKINKVLVSVQSYYMKEIQVCKVEDYL